MTDNWSGAGNWNGGLPVAGDDVHIAPNDGVARTVNYNVSAPPLAGFLVDLTGPGAERTTFEMASGTLSNTGFIVGAHGRATFNQSGGTHTQTPPYDGAIGHYAGGNGVYNLSGTGTLSLSRDLYLGLHAGSAGAFSQTGGSVAVARNMNLGLDPGAWGGYSLTAGELSVGAGLYVGGNGTGSFVQNGGNVNVSGGIIAGGPAGKGSYSIASGTLSAEGMSVGGNGVGSFEQSGGEVAVIGSVAIGARFARSTYAISSGALSAASMSVGGNGAFRQSGGVVAVGSISVDGIREDAPSGFAIFSGGTTTVAGNIDLIFFGILEITGGDVVVGGAINMAELGEDLHLRSGTLVASQYFPGSGNFHWTGGVLSVGSYSGPLTVPAGGTLAPATTVGVPSFSSSAILGNYIQAAGATFGDRDWRSNCGYKS